MFSAACCQLRPIVGARVSGLRNEMSNEGLAGTPKSGYFKLTKLLEKNECRLLKYRQNLLKV